MENFVTFIAVQETETLRKMLEALSLELTMRGAHCMNDLKRAIDECKRPGVRMEGRRRVVFDTLFHGEGVSANASQEKGDRRSG